MMRKRRQSTLKYQRKLRERRRDALRQSEFKRQFGGFMNVHGGFLGGARQMDHLKQWRQKEKRANIRWQSERMAAMMQNQRPLVVAKCTWLRFQKGECGRRTWDEGRVSTLRDGRFRDDLRAIAARRARTRYNIVNMPPPVEGGLGAVPPMAPRSPLDDAVWPPPPPRIQLLDSGLLSSKPSSGAPNAPDISLVSPDRRRLGHRVQAVIDGIHADNDYDAVMTKPERRRLDRILRLEEMAKTYGVGEYAEGDLVEYDAASNLDPS